MDVFGGVFDDVFGGIFGEVDGGSGTVPVDQSHYNTTAKRFTLIQGDDYRFANGGHVDFDIDFTGDPTGWTVEVGAWSKYRGSFDGVGSLVQSGSEHVLRVEWDGDATLAKCSGDEYIWQARLVDPDGLARTKVDGPLTLNATANE